MNILHNKDEEAKDLRKPVAKLPQLEVPTDLVSPRTTNAP